MFWAASAVACIASMRRVGPGSTHGRPGAV